MRRNLDVVLASVSEATHAGQWSPTDVRRQVAPDFDLMSRQAICELTGTGFGALSSSGSAALRYGLEALGVGWGDVVAIPSSTWIAVPEAVLSVGARPLLIPTDEVGNMRLDCMPEALAGHSPRAAIVVHSNGIPADVGEVRRILPDWCRVLEDFSQAHGASVEGRPVGSLGDAGACSFHATKLIACGEGGAFVSDDEDLVHRFGALTTNGRAPRPPQIGRLDYEPRDNDSLVGSNARLSAFGSAVLHAQLGGYGEYVEACWNGWERIASALHDSPMESLQTTVSGSVPYCLPLRARPQQGERAARVLAELQAHGYAKPATRCLHELSERAFDRPSLRWFRDDLLYRQFGIGECRLCASSTTFFVPHTHLADDRAVDAIARVIRSQR